MIKNLKQQQKESFENYVERPTPSGAKDVVDCMVKIQEHKEEIKQYKNDIKANIKSLTEEKK
jgi:hypothetical protein